MSESTNTIGYTADVPKHLLLNSGAIYTNYGLADEKLFGAVASGNEFDVAIKTYSPKVAGITNSNVKGLQFITDVAVSLKVNMLEFTTDILNASLQGSVVDTTTNPNYDIITLPMTGGVGNQTYLDNIALITTLSGSNLPVVIILKNAMATGGIKIKVEDAKDNTMPLTFEAFSDPLNPKDSPFEIYYPKVFNDITPLTLVGSPIIDNGKVLLTFSDTVNTAVFKDGFAVKLLGATDVITAISRGVNQLNTILLTLTTAPTSGQAVTVAYTLPASGVQITSASGAILDSFAAITVVNN